ncbi:MAG TPA: hypothetical protein VF522_03980 [Ramlibacter sp.]|uniref:hypothetical protein n=1 Tax=Ramlibacter sp. TaxID=1917967 RepID=UPI002ED24574
MFGWLRKRGNAAPPTSASASSKKDAPARRAAAADPLAVPAAFQDTAPLPEVVGEGNTQADWSAWEDSMTALDSQLQSLLPSDRVYVRDTRPSQLDELDPFSSVRGKHDR